KAGTNSAAIAVDIQSGVRVVSIVTEEILSAARVEFGELVVSQAHPVFIVLPNLLVEPFPSGPGRSTHITSGFAIGHDLVGVLLQPSNHPSSAFLVRVPRHQNGCGSPSVHVRV